MFVIHPESRLLRPTEVARWLKVTPQTVVRMARRGDLPARRIASQWRFLKVEIDEWLRSEARS